MRVWICAIELSYFMVVVVGGWGVLESMNGRLFATMVLDLTHDNLISCIITPGKDLFYRILDLSFILNSLRVQPSLEILILQTLVL